MTTTAGTDRPLRRRVGAGLLAAFVAAVAVDGFAWPLGYGHRTFWPFDRAWWMFHRDDGQHHHLRFAVRREGGRVSEADVDRWFAAPASQATRRYDEVPRDRGTLRALVAYLCRRHRREGSPGGPWRTVTVTDTAWRQTPGRRVPLRDVPWGELRVTVLLRDEPCPAEGP